MASSLPPVKATAFTFYVALVSQADTDVFKTSATLAAGDVKVSKDGGAFSNVATLPTEIGTSGVLSCPLSATEMNADVVTVKFSDAAGAEWQDALVVIYTAAQTLDTTDGVADTISAIVGHTDYGNAKLVRSATPANALVVIAGGAAAATVTSMGANTVDAAAIATDAGAEIAAAVRTNLATELAHLDADVSSAGGGLTAQETRDAMKLAPTSGSPAAGSVDAHLDSLLAYGVGTGTGTYTDTVTDGVDPLDNVLVQLSTDAAGANMVYRAYTGADGAFTLRPDPGTYYVWFELAGYSFTQGAQVVVT